MSSSIESILTQSNWAEKLSLLNELSTGSALGASELTALIENSRDEVLTERLLTLCLKWIAREDTPANPLLEKTLEGCCESEHPAVRTLALKCLMGLWNKKWARVQPALLALLKNDTLPLETLTELLELCGNLAHADLIPFLEKQSHHAEYSIRQKAVEALGKIGGQPVLLPLLNSLFDPEKEVRSAALWGLDMAWTEMGDRAVAVLVDLLNTTPEGDVRTYLIDTLKRTGDERLQIILGES